jgi:hypothetical protein
LWEKNQYSLAEMALAEQQGSPDDVWQENWFEILGQLANRTIKTYVRSK